MKIVGFIPYWLSYHFAENITGEMIKLGGRYIINYSVELMNNSALIDEVVIFSSTPEVLDYVEGGLKYNYLKRGEYLDNENISIEDIISNFLQNTSADIIVLLHPNSPFLKTTTLDECINKVRSNEYDSSFTSFKFQKFTWFNGQPLNYSLDKPTPGLGSVEPVYIEQSSLYVFSRKCFEKTLKRNGGKTYMCCINNFEGHDIKSKEDYEIAELIVNSGLTM